MARMTLTKLYPRDVEDLHEASENLAIVANALRAAKYANGPALIQLLIRANDPIVRRAPFKVVTAPGGDLAFEIFLVRHSPADGQQRGRQFPALNVLLPVRTFEKGSPAFLASCHLLLPQGLAPFSIARASGASHLPAGFRLDE